MKKTTTNWLPKKWRLLGKMLMLAVLPSTGMVEMLHAQCNWPASVSAYGTGTANTTCLPATTGSSQCHYFSEYATFNGLTIGQTYTITTTNTTTVTGNPFGIGVYNSSSSGTVPMASATSATFPFSVTFVATATTVYTKTFKTGCSSSGNDCNYFTLLCNSCASTAGTNQPATTSVAAGTPAVQVVRADVPACSTTGDVTSLTFTTNGTTNPADILNAKVYYTTSTTFGTSSQFGTTVTSPNGTFTVTGTQNIPAASTGYFWVTYDVACNAATTNVLDAALSSYIFGGVTSSPATPNPTGTREITAIAAPTYTATTTTNTPVGTADLSMGRTNILGNTCTNNVTEVKFNTSTTPAGDLSQAKCYYTTSTTFSTSTPFGTAVAAPNGDITFTGSQNIALGSGNYFWLAYDVSCTAPVADSVTAIPVSITANGTTTAVATPSTNAKKGITAGTASTYTATTTNNVAAGTGQLSMGRTNITGTSCINNVTQVKFNTATSTASNILQARCYYTTSTTFATTTQFGSAVISPSGEITFTGSQNLAAGGGNYFWLAYDVPCAATVGDSLSATPVSITANSITSVIATPSSNPKKGITAQTSYNTVSDGEWSNGATWACGVPPSDANNVTINNNVTVTSSGNKVGNITIAAGKSLIITSGNLTMGPDGGGNKTLTNNGILTINGGTLNANGNVILAAGCTFNMSSGNLNIDPNNGTSGGSVASGTTIFAIGSSSSAITANVTGGNILINDPPFAGSGYSVAMNTNVAMAWAGNTIQFGGTTGIHPSANGFIVECYVNSNRLAFGNVIINGNDPAKPVTDATYGMSAVNNLTINAESELRIGSGSFSSFAGNITNNGTLTVTGALRLEAPAASLTSSTPTTNAQVISGSGIFRNLTSSPTANFNNLVINNSNANGVTFNANALLSGANTGTLSGTLTMTTGIVNTGGNSLIVGISNAAAGTYTYSGGIVMGKLKRWVAAATGSTVFNIGNTAGAKTATINFTTAPTAAGSLTAEWVSGDPGANGLPLTEGPNNLAYVSTNGYWRITAGDGLTGGAYTATLNGVSVADVSDYTKLTIGKRANAAANWSLDGTYAAPTGSNANFTISRTDIATGFSEFGILMGSVPLPVTLKSFTGKNAGSVNNLNWQTAEEKNFSHFELLRSADGKDFSKLNTIRASGNASGNSYAYTDERPFEGKNFYRLNMVDADGRARLSDVVELSVKSGSGLAVSIHPNPVAQQLHININGKMDGKGQIQVLDITGKVLQTVPVSNNSSISVDMSQLPAGTYMIRYTDNSHQQVSKVTKS